MVENDYPVPSYLSDVLFLKPDGWIETPEADADSKPGYQSVYAIDCEMARALHCMRGIVLTKPKMSSVHHCRRCLRHQLCNRQSRI